MLERGCGQIVNVLSVLGKFGYLLRAPYSAAKFALNGYMSTLRLEVCCHASIGVERIFLLYPRQPCIVTC